MEIPCMSYIRNDFLDKIPDCPIIITRPETVYDRLKEYVFKKEELKEIGLKGKAFVQKYHDPYVVADIIINRYNSKIRTSPHQQHLYVYNSFVERHL